MIVRCTCKGRVCMYYTGARVVVVDITVADGTCRSSIRVHIIQSRVPQDTVYYVNRARIILCIDDNAANGNTRMRRCIVGNGAVDDAACGNVLRATPDTNTAD